MKLKTLNKSLAISLFAITSGFAVQASAASFTFTQYGGFVANPAIPQADYEGLVSGGADVIPVGAPVYSEMNWNNSSPTRSSLVLSTVTGPEPLAENVWTTISTLTHNNIVIPEGTNWSGQDILGRLVVTDNEGGSFIALDDESAITLDFWETQNSGTCPLDNPNGTVCDDLFAFTAVGLGNLTFEDAEGNDWLAEFQFANLVNAFQDGNTVWTGESQTSSLDVQMRVTMQTTTPVPEPATLSILGLGLLGLGMARRRKFNA